MTGAVPSWGTAGEALSTDKAILDIAFRLHQFPYRRWRATS
jgi:hypothetical protein